MKSTNTYPNLIKITHWLTVLVIILLYITAYARDKLTTQLQSANWYLLVTHINLGLLVFILTIVALALHFALPRPNNQHLSTLSRNGAKFMHFMLYAMLLAMPLCAYIGTGFDVPVLSRSIFLPSFSRFDWAKQLVSDMDMTMIGFLEPFSRFHQDLGADIILPALLVGHILAALYHHFALKDVTLRQMWFVKK